MSGRDDLSGIRFGLQSAAAYYTWTININFWAFAKNRYTYCMPFGPLLIVGTLRILPTNGSKSQGTPTVLLLLFSH